MTTPLPLRRSRSMASRLAEQELTLADGETPIPYADLVAMANAVAALAARHLPTKAARLHLARCRRLFKPFLDDREEERQAIQQAHAPDATGEASEGDRLSFRDPLGLARDLADLDQTLVPVRLPAPITDAMLPVNDKAHPNNEDGLALIVADLGPLYEIAEGEP